MYISAYVLNDGVSVLRKQLCANTCRACAVNKEAERQVKQPGRFTVDLFLTLCQC